LRHGAGAIHRAGDWGKSPIGGGPTVSAQDAFSGTGMSRASIILIIIVLLIVALFVWLSTRSHAVQTHPIEQVVTLNGAANANP
jgi:hypothetical protein